MATYSDTAKQLGINPLTAKEITSTLSKQQYDKRILFRKHLFLSEELLDRGKELIKIEIPNPANNTLVYLRRIAYLLANTKGDFIHYLGQDKNEFYIYELDETASHLACKITIDYLSLKIIDIEIKEQKETINSSNLFDDIDLELGEEIAEANKKAQLKKTKRILENCSYFNELFTEFIVLSNLKLNSKHIDRLVYFNSQLFNLIEKINQLNIPSKSEILLAQKEAALANSKLPHWDKYKFSNHFNERLKERFNTDINDYEDKSKLLKILLVNIEYRATQNNKQIWIGENNLFGRYFIVVDSINLILITIYPIKQNLIKNNDIYSDKKLSFDLNIEKLEQLEIEKIKNKYKVLKLVNYFILFKLSEAFNFLNDIKNLPVSLDCYSQLQEHLDNLNLFISKSVIALNVD